MRQAHAAQEARVRLAEFAIRLSDGRRGASGPWFDLSLGVLEAGQLEHALTLAGEALEFAGGCLSADRVGARR